MNDMNEAYAALGLSADASKDELEKRYDLLLRQARAQQRRGEIIIDEDLVRRAYNFILEDERKKASEKYYLETYGKHKKHAQTAEKIDHFFQYYKFHAIAAIILVIVIIFSLKSYAEHRAEQARLAALPPPDVSVIFFGEYDGSYPPEELEESMLALFPDWQRIDTQVVFVPLEPRDEFEIAMLQRSAITLATEKPEIFIMDRGNFDKLAYNGLYIRLDELYMGTNNVLTDQNKVIYTKSEEDLIDHAYGIDITEQLTAMFPTLGREMIVGISLHSDENTGNALRFIKTFLNE